MGRSSRNIGLLVVGAVAVSGCVEGVGVESPRGPRDPSAEVSFLDAFPADGAAGAAAPAAPLGHEAVPESEPLHDSAAQDTGVACLEDPAQVAVLGDSYVDWPTHTFVPDLAAESGQQWNSYAVGGTSMATGGLLGLIPSQFETAIANTPNIKVVVMDGGGNDIILPDTAKFPAGAECTRSGNSPSISDCQAIVAAALDGAATLLQRMADAGVEHVVYFFYPHIPGGGLISGPTPNQILDYAHPMVRELCATTLASTQGKLNCHFVDMVPAFQGRPELFRDIFSETGDGVHPNAEGSKVMAREVWRTMREDCVAQPMGSGCCVAPTEL